MNQSQTKRESNLYLREVMLLAFLILLVEFGLRCKPHITQPPTKKVVNLHIAALEVKVPPRAANVDTVHALAYVEIRTDEEHELAEAITNETRKKGKALQEEETAKASQLDGSIEEKIEELSSLLQRRFQTNPEPLVLRVAAGNETEYGKSTSVEVVVRLTNLLPREDQVFDLNDPASPRFGQTPWSSTTAIHASLVGYDASTSDGAAIGWNNPSIVIRGDSHDYHWIIDQELGVCYLRDMADPTHQLLGLFGALIVEPPGTRFERAASTYSYDQPGWEALIISSTNPEDSFREFVIFTHDNWEVKLTHNNSTQKVNAINYYSAIGLADKPPTPKMMVHSGDRVLVRQIHAAGIGGPAGNHVFFIDSQRWPFDFQNERSNRISAIALATSAAFNLRLRSQPDVKSEQRYIYGCHVGEHFINGEWGLFVILPRASSQIRSLKVP